MQVAMGFVGDYAPGGLSPQMYDMPVILTKPCTPRRCTGLSQLGFIAARKRLLILSIDLVFVEVNALESCSRQRLRCCVQIALDIHLAVADERLME